MSLPNNELRKQILVKMMAALEADDDDGYCEGYDALLKFERGTGEFDGPEEPTCRICGCTDDIACPDGCWWVEPDLCSSCVGQAYPDPPVDQETDGKSLHLDESSGTWRPAQ